MAQMSLAAPIVLRIELGDQPPEVMKQLVGPQGIQGERGPHGPHGPTGPRGDFGPQGKEGKQGLPGPKGAEGPQGKEGKQGEEGKRGEAGPRGPVGPTRDVPSDALIFWMGDDIPAGWTPEKREFPAWWVGVWGGQSPHILRKD